MLSGGYASGTLDNVIQSMVDNARKKLILAAVTSQALMAWAFASGRVETEDGGANITQPLTIGRNPNITTAQYYDTVPMVQTSPFTTVKYGWSRVVGSVIVSDQEEDENQGPNQLFKILTAQMDLLEQSIKEQFSIWLHGAGAGITPLGLQALIPDDPTTGTLAGVDRGLNPWWRTSSYNFNGTLDSTNIEVAMDDVLLDLKVGPDKPDLILMGRNLLRTYRQAVRNKVVINISDTNMGKAMFDLGFEGVSHNNVPVIYDEVTDPNRMYFINSKFLRLHMLKGVNMKQKKLVAPWNVDASGSRVIWQGQWCLWRAYRTHAVVRA